MAVLEMHIHDDSRVLPIIFGGNTLLVFQLENLVIEEVNFLNITDPSILIAELIDVSLKFELSRGLLILAVGLVHFGYDFGLLLNGPDGPVTSDAPGLGAYVLNEAVLTGLAFL
jgi:hypothetical protein